MNDNCKKMINAPIYLSPPHLSENELQYIQQAIESNWVAPVGENLDKFEQKICDFTASKYALALNSGTAAIHLALILLGVGKGDTVICPTFTFAATANPIIYQGATPIFVDSETQSWNISPEFCEKAILDSIQKGKKPKAMIIVHLYGNPANLDALIALGKQYEIPIIEDAAEALGATYQEKKVGTLGDLGVFSFNGNKIITTSAGGALIANDKIWMEQALYLATQAKDKTPYYQHSAIGYNYRLSNILAGIGLGQMEVLEDRIKKRRANFEFYKANLTQYTFQEELTAAFSNRWLTCIVGSDTLEELRQALAEEHIESRPLWKPLHTQPIFQSYPYYGERIAVDLFNRGLCLPSGSNLSEADLDKIISVILN